MYSDLDKKELEAFRIIWNYHFRTGALPSIRKLQNLLGYKSPRSSAIILESLMKKEILNKDENGKYFFTSNTLPSGELDNASTTDIPLLGTISCGSPIYAEEHIEGMIPVSTKLIKSSEQYFILRAYGNSMDKKGIGDGDLVLIKKQQTASTGDIVAALVDNEVTIKELIINDNNIVLKPHSTNRKHFPIVLTTDFRIQGIVESVIKL